MILFKRLNYKNFLSSGNQPIVIDLDKSQMTLIVGTNGMSATDVFNGNGGTDTIRIDAADSAGNVTADIDFNDVTNGGVWGRYNHSGLEGSFTPNRWVGWRWLSKDPLYWIPLSIKEDNKTEGQEIFEIRFLSIKSKSSCTR